MNLLRISITQKAAFDRPTRSRRQVMVIAHNLSVPRTTNCPTNGEAKGVESRPSSSGPAAAARSLGLVVEVLLVLCRARRHDRIAETALAVLSS